MGYIIERSTSSTGPFTFGGNFVASLTETAYTDNALSLGTNYYYVVAAVNVGGVSPNSAIMGTASGPSAPSSLSAIAGNAQVTLIWLPRRLARPATSSRAAPVPATRQPPSPPESPATSSSPTPA